MARFIIQFFVMLFFRKSIDNGFLAPPVGGLEPINEDQKIEWRKPSVGKARRAPRFRR